MATHMAQRQLAHPRHVKPSRCNHQYSFHPFWIKPDRIGQLSSAETYRILSVCATVPAVKLVRFLIRNNIRPTSHINMHTTCYYISCLQRPSPGLITPRRERAWRKYAYDYAKIHTRGLKTSLKPDSGWISKLGLLWCYCLDFFIKILCSKRRKTHLESICYPSIHHISVKSQGDLWWSEKKSPPHITTLLDELNHSKKTCMNTYQMPMLWKLHPCRFSHGWVYRFAFSLIEPLRDSHWLLWGEKKGSTSPFRKLGLQL